MRFHETPRFQQLGFRQRVEVSKDQGWPRVFLSLSYQRLELFKLTTDRGVRIDMRIQNTKAARTKRNSCSHGQPWSPGALVPRQVDARDVA